MKIWLAAAMTLGLMTPALAEVAEEFRNLARTCLNGRVSEKESKLDDVLNRTFADELEALAQTANETGTLDDLRPVLNAEAAYCVATAREITIGVAFDPERNLYVSIDILNERNDTLASVAQETAPDAVTEAAADPRPRANRLTDLERTVNARAARVCTSLAASSPASIYRNPLCSRMYRMAGQPLQPSR